MTATVRQTHRLRRSRGLGKVALQRSIRMRDVGAVSRGRFKRMGGQCPVWRHAFSGPILTPLPDHQTVISPAR